MTTYNITTLCLKTSPVLFFESVKRQSILIKKFGLYSIVSKRATHSSNFVHLALKL